VTINSDSISVDVYDPAVEELLAEVAAPTVEVVEGLIEELHKAAEAYYQKSGDSGLTDEEFDAKLDYLETLEQSGAYEKLFEAGSKGFLLLEGDPALGTKVAADTVIEHNSPMLSLGKAKKPEELLAFLRKARAAGAKDFRLQAKLDGLALSVRYVDGKLSIIATRGDGVHGEDTTYLVDDSNVTVKGLPLTISTMGTVEVRGELFFTEAQFKAADDARFAKTSERFSLSRNAASGLLKKAKGGVGYPVEFTFATYSALQDSKMIDLDSLDSANGFVTVDSITVTEAGDSALTGFSTDDDVLKAVESFGKVRETFGIPTDGVVIKPTNESEMNGKMGFTSHHPVSQIAWKYPAENAQTVVIGIDVTVGKTGKLTPIARIAPVMVAGSKIENASLHNYNLVATKDVRIGSTVLIEKANDIIPQIKVVLKNLPESVAIEVPTNCPACEETLTFKDDGVWPPRTLLCPNTTCPSRDFFALKSAVGKNYFDIDGLSEVTLTYLNEVDRVKNISDLFTLTVEELADSALGYTAKGTARRLGEKRAEHIIEYIEKSKTKPLPKILAGLNIDLLGRTAAKKLEAAFGDIDGILAATEADIAAIDGFGPIGAEKIHRGLKLRTGLIAELREHGVTFGKLNEASESVATDEDADLSSEAPAGGIDLTGISFAISGAVPEPFANRGAWVDFVESKGGEFHSGPKATTTYMVGDKLETSSKINKAHQLGLDFITAEEFTKNYCS
jgi:DNA ligase (NAD+)